MLKLNPLFADGAVLCRGREIPVFGSAEDGAAVSAELRDAHGVLLGRGAATAVSGRFLLYLPPQEAQTGCELTVTSGAETARCRDVAVGEVWLAGGQSNMEMALVNADGGPAEIAAHDDALLRFFDVPRWARDCPEADAAFDAVRWQKAAPGAAGGVSAVAYWFAKRRRADTGAPVGIIDCWWGGTSVTCWLDGETLAATAAGQTYLREWAEKSEGVTMDAYLAAEKIFTDNLDAWNRRVAQVKTALPPDAPWAAIEAEAGPCPWFPPYGPGSQYRPAGLYGTMLRRIMPAGLNGILYYQGEEDACRTDRYDLLMGQLIGLWRRDFRDASLPFLFVQLPGWGGAEDHEAWARLRWQQEEVHRALRSTGLAVTIDLGDRENIHPTDKRPVGERLADQALRVADGADAPESPRVAGIALRGREAALTLSAPVAGEPAGFETMGPDGAWRPAQAEVRGAEILLRSDREITAARYAWLDWPEVKLFGLNGLPLAPWRSEGCWS